MPEYSRDLYNNSRQNSDLFKNQKRSKPSIISNVMVEILSNIAEINLLICLKFNSA